MLKNTRAMKVNEFINKESHRYLTHLCCALSDNDSLSGQVKRA